MTVISLNVNERAVHSIPSFSLPFKNKEYSMEEGHFLIPQLITFI